MKKISLLLVSLLAVLMGARAQSGRLSTLYPTDVLDGILASPDTFKPVPTAADSYWRSLPTTFRQSYINNARAVTNPDWSQIPDSLFAEYRQNGNRTHYESQSFSRRNNLARLVMGEIMDHQGTFIPQILNGLNYLKEEVWWGVPAHYSNSKPSAQVQTVDLFNAETANLVAWTIYMLQDELEAASPGICATMKSEVQRRVLVPAIDNTYYWMSIAGNWNSWISENWLSCALLCETDRSRQLRGIEKVMTDLDAFANKYPQDGGCDEGISYWDRAGGSFFECGQLLYLGTNGQIDLRGDALLQRMGAFIYNMYIGNNYYVDYADAGTYATPNINMLYPFGRFVGDSVLSRMGAYLAQRRSFTSSPATLFNSSGNWPSVSREVLFLAQYYSDLRAETAHEPLVGDSWYPNIEVMTARSRSGSTTGLFLSAKAGNNDEAHNHNDLGNFIVYRNGQPLIVDIGSATYTAQTFSDQRYELFNTRSTNHNVPLINGYEQKDGADYKSTKVRYTRQGDVVIFSQDLAKAYVADAGVKSWVRTLAFDRSSIKVREQYALSTLKQAPELHFMLPLRPTMTKPDSIILRSNGGSCYLLLDTAAVEASVETLSLSGQGASSLWGNALYRLILKPRSTALTNLIDYSIVQMGGTSKEATALTLDRHELSLTFDTLAAQLTPTLAPEGNVSFYTWTSSHPAVAVVGTTGVVTATGSGNAVITCATPQGLSDSCRVHVAEGIATIDIQGDAYTDAANPAVKYGQETTLIVKKSDTSSDCAGYLLFPMKAQVPEGLTATSNATCKVVLYAAEVGSYYNGMSWYVYPLSATRWNETSITYNTARNYKPTLTNLLAQVAERPVSDTLLANRVEFDVTSYVLSNLNSARVAFYLTQNINPGSNNSATAFSTHDDLDVTVHPRLVFLMPDLVNAIGTVNVAAKPERVNVYTLDGVHLRRGVSADHATDGLPSGLYIVGHRKVLVK